VDLAGYLSELTADAWEPLGPRQDQTRGVLIDPSVPGAGATLHTVRGGNLSSNAYQLRAGYRSQLSDTSTKVFSVGLRCVRPAR